MKSVDSNLLNQLTWQEPNMIIAPAMKYVIATIPTWTLAVSVVAAILCAITIAYFIGD